jgi:transaldolase
MPIKIFADGANRDDIIELNKNPLIEGFTTNPTLLKKAGITNYEGFAKDILNIVKEKPISFEVFSDSSDGMIEQALKISSWGKNIFVKIPIMNTKGIYTTDVMEFLSKNGVKINATAIMTVDQVKMVSEAIKDNAPCIISVFAGRIFDTQIDATQIVIESSNAILCNSQQILWASPRQVFDVVLAQQCGADIITMTPDLIKKMIALKNKNLFEYSLETCQMFYNDAKEAGFEL